MPNPDRKVELGISDEHAIVGDHIAFLWKSPEEFADGVGFLCRGFEADDYGVIFGHREANEQVISVLRERGVDVDKLLTSGRLSIMRGSEDAGAMLAGIGASFRESADKGARVIRLLGNIGWGRPGWPGDPEILDFEAKVTEAARLFPCVVVCMYEMQPLSQNETVKDAFEAHPITIQSGIQRENPYRVSTGEYVTERRVKAATPIDDLV